MLLTTKTFSSFMSLDTTAYHTHTHIPAFASSRRNHPLRRPVFRSFADGRPPDPLPCQNCLNTRDKSFVGGWVSDVVLGNPVGDVLMGFMDQEVGLSTGWRPSAAGRPPPKTNVARACCTKTLYWV